MFLLKEQFGLFLIIVTQGELVSVAGVSRGAISLQARGVALSRSLLHRQGAQGLDGHRRGRPECELDPDVTAAVSARHPTPCHP